jgi:hypothetical protein
MNGMAFRHRNILGPCATLDIIAADFESLCHTVRRRHRLVGELFKATFLDSVSDGWRFAAV